MSNIKSMHFKMDWLLVKNTSPGASIQDNETWMKFYNDLKSHFKKYGNLQLSAKARSKESPSLMDWVLRHRYEMYFFRDKYNLIDERVAFLDEINFEWIPKDAVNYSWVNQYFGLLKETNERQIVHIKIE